LRSEHEDHRAGHLSRRRFGGLFCGSLPEPSLSQSILQGPARAVAAEGEARAPAPAPAITEDEEAEKYIKAQAIGNAAHAIMIGRGKTLEIIKANDFKGGEAQEAARRRLCRRQNPDPRKASDIALGSSPAGES
jgi:hypothetical protein